MFCVEGLGLLVLWLGKGDDEGWKGSVELEAVSNPAKGSVLVTTGGGGGGGAREILAEKGSVDAPLKEAKGSLKLALLLLLL